MGYCKAILLLLTLCALAAHAQEQQLIAANRTPCLVCLTSEVRYRSDNPTLSPVKGSFQDLQDQTAAQRAPGELVNLHALEGLHLKFHHWFHTEHNPRLYSVAAEALTNLYSRRSHLFNDWFHPAKGIDLFQVLGGRFAVGFEAQRVLVFEGDRGSRPFRDTAMCSIPGLRGMGPCGPDLFRAGELRYGLTFRWKLK